MNVVTKSFQNEADGAIGTGLNTNDGYNVNGYFRGGNNQQQFVVSFAYSFISLFEGADDNRIPFKDYVPPPLLRDVQILDQTFLI